MNDDVEIAVIVSAGSRTSGEGHAVDRDGHGGNCRRVQVDVDTFAFWGSGGRKESWIEKRHRDRRSTDDLRIDEQLGPRDPIGSDEAR